MAAHRFGQYLLPRVALVIALGSICASASGQVEYQSGRTTEIWITGEDVAVTRRLPQGHQRADLSDNDEFAKSMMQTAYQSYAAGDVDAANWLAQWARRLTNGRVGSKEFAHPASPSAAIPLEDAADGVDRKPIGIITFSEVKTPAGLEIQPPDPPILIPVNVQSAGQTEQRNVRVNVPLASVQEMNVPLASVQKQDSPPVPNSETRIANPPTEEPRAPAGHVAIVEDTISASAASTHAKDRQVAVAGSTETSPDNTQHTSYTLPPVTNSVPIILASFASGVALCLVLCLVLFKMPVRLRIEHANGPRRMDELPTDPPANRSLGETAPRRRTARPGADTAMDREVENSHKQKSSIIEDVYRMNVELHQQGTS